MSTPLINSTCAPSEIEKPTSVKVAEILATNHIHFAAEYNGQRKRENWDCDSWLITFLNGNNDKRADFEFFTGLGHRAEVTEGVKNRVMLESFRDLTAYDLKTNNSYARRYRAACTAARKPTAPDAATVLHSLISDNSACTQSFENWCADYGYDNDSRKAFATYELCQKNGDKLHRVLGEKLIAELSEMLQDF